MGKSKRGAQAAARQDTHVKVDEVLRLVRYVAAKVAAHHRVPSGPVLFVELLLDVGRNVLLNVELLHRLGGGVDGVLLHVLGLQGRGVGMGAWRVRTGAARRRGGKRRDAPCPRSAAAGAGSCARVRGGRAWGERAREGAGKTVWGSARRRSRATPAAPHSGHARVASMGPHGVGGGLGAAAQLRRTAGAKRGRTRNEAAWRASHLDNGLQREAWGEVGGEIMRSA